MSAGFICILLRINSRVPGCPGNKTELVRYRKKIVPGHEALLDELNAFAGRSRHDGSDEIRGDYLGFDQDFSFGKVGWLLNCREVKAKNRNQAERQQKIKKTFFSVYRNSG